MKRRIIVAASLGIGALFAPASALAHSGVGEVSGFLSGFLHPFAGVDHLLAMVAVGLWAAQTGGRATWALPCAFVGVMAVGGALGMLGASLPLVEPGILASVLALGVLIAAAARLPLVGGALLVALFALFHGHAHGSEMPISSGAFAYSAGFVLATALLHAAGIGAVAVFRRLALAPATRVAGAVIALLGVYLAL